MSHSVPASPNTGQAPATADPPLDEARPRGAWVIAGFLLFAIISMWALVFGLFLQRN